jgi:hypothetical protein
MTERLVARATATSWRRQSMRVRKRADRVVKPDGDDACRVVCSMSPHFFFTAFFV